MEKFFLKLLGIFQELYIVDQEDVTFSVTTFELWHIGCSNGINELVHECFGGYVLYP